ncbi:Protein CBG25642 [Caenorhabditis briggsae]|nr:Protein CBG25642 [Caenorhabditis briggsae]UMM18836.1 hypothetical protein L5515_014718 [Caenorhabditis briggsae]CAR98606.1 Protein CBG25642 [Caenorhabditis briggsae]
MSTNQHTTTNINNTMKENKKNASTQTTLSGSHPSTSLNQVLSEFHHSKCIREREALERLMRRYETGRQRNLRMVREFENSLI